MLSRDHETGNPLAGLSGAQRARRGWACHLANRPAVPRDWFRGIPERYVAGGACPERSRRNNRGRREGRPYPWSQQVIHEISGLERGLGMNRTYTSTILPLLFVLVLGLFATNLASAQWKIQKTPPPVQDTDLSVSPSRGPADAPVAMGVFSCFQ